MKRILVLLLIVIFLFSVSGCTNSFSELSNFYYCSVDYQFGEDMPVVQSESRDISNHEGELSYLISLYLAGPSNKKLESLFPKNTKLVSVQTGERNVTIELSYLGKQLSDSEFVLACACLTLTTMDFTDAEEVTIISGEKTLTMEKDDLMLYDTITAATEAEVTE